MAQTITATAGTDGAFANRTTHDRTLSKTSAAYQAYQILHLAFVVAPVVAGIDKFFHFLANWDAYLAPIVPRMLGIPAHTFMLGVGIVEMAAGVVVAFAPRIGGWVVGAWLFGIVL